MTKDECKESLKFLVLLAFISADKRFRKLLEAEHKKPLIFANLR